MPLLTPFEQMEKQRLKTREREGHGQNSSSGWCDSEVCSQPSSHCHFPGCQGPAPPTLPRDLGLSLA